MKKFIFLILLSCGLLQISAQTIEFTYTFDNYTIKPGIEYSSITFDNTILSGPAGNPALPYYSVRLLLPPGNIASSVEVFGEDETAIPGQFMLYPAQHNRPLSEQKSSEQAKNVKLYQSNGVYPSKANGELTTSFMNGYSIAMTAVTPLRYIPAQGKVSYYQSIRVVVHYKPDIKAMEALNNIGSERIAGEVSKFISNPDAIKTYPQKAIKSDDYQLLIITPQQFQNNFSELAGIYLDRGIKTTITTKEYISSNGTGQDLPEKIRNYIIQEYQQKNIEFVLLGGDVEHVPYRGFYCHVQSSSVYEDDNIPADLYYAALDGNWNTNGNNLWGEIGEDDLLPELGVGRFPVSNTTELNSMLHKTIFYQNSPVTGELRNPLMAGEFLWSDPETYGEDYLELLIGLRNDNGYTTNGIPTNYNFEKLYESQSSWGSQDLIAAINQGKSFVHHSGHANETYVAYLSNSDITNSNFSGANGTTHNYTLMFSHGCNCGSFDYNDCIMEKMVTIDNFAVALWGNSRYGWFNEGQTEGPAAHLHRELVDAMFNEKMNHIGEAYKECKIQTAPWVTAPGQWEEGALRWNFYDNNIFGDPALSVWTDEPVSITANYQTAVPIGSTYVNVTVNSGGSPAVNFTCAVLMNGVLYGAAATDNNGLAVVNFDPVFTVPGDAQLIISGYNCIPTVFPLTIIPNSGPYVVYQSMQIDDSNGNNNGQVDTGEDIGLTIELENVGSLPATDVNATLSTTDPYVTITDATASYGTIQAGQSAMVNNGFAFSVSEDVPDNHNIAFVLEIVSSENFTAYFNITAFAPALSIGTLLIDDSQGGNGDGVLDPGESVVISIAASNTGHCEALNTISTISSMSSFLTITDDEYPIGVLGAGQTADAEFTADVSASAPLGTVIDLTNTLTSGSYSTEAAFFLTVGLMVEDFETGNFSAFNWQNSGDANWTVSTQSPYEGTYSAKSGAIDDNETSGLFISMNVTTNDEISFFRKVSSEDNYDFLKFYIDNTLQDEWSGEVNWSEVSYPVSSGNHTFKWIYEKDVSVASGSDCAFVDYIIFPSASGSGGNLSVNATATPAAICQGETSQLNAIASGGSGTYTYLWTPSASLNNPNIQNPVATPSATTTYTVIINDGANSISDQVVVTVNDIPPTPVITQSGNYLYSSAISGNQWYNNSGMIPGATSQIFYPSVTGSYYVIVSNQAGCESDPSNIINFIYTVTAENQGQEINIFPNPAADILFINSDKSSNGNMSVFIYDHTGKEVFSSNTDAGNLNSGYTINLNNLRNGVYSVRINSEDFTLVRKLVISK